MNDATLGLLQYLRDYASEAREAAQGIINMVDVIDSYTSPADAAQIATAWMDLLNAATARATVVTLDLKATVAVAR